MPILIALAASFSIAFPGGTGPELADALAKSHGTVAVVLLDSAKPFSGVKTETDDPVVFGNRVHKATGLRAPKNGTGYAPAGWPVSMRPSSAFRFDVDAFPGRSKIDEWDAEVDGKQVTLKRPGSGILQVSDLERVAFDKPVKVHEFYGRALVGISSGTWTTQQILGAVGQAVGATVLEKPTYYELKCNPKVYRTRLSVALAEEAALLEKSTKDPVHLAQTQLTQAAVEAMSDAQIEAYFQQKAESIALDVAPGSPLAVRCMRYLTAYAKREDMSNLSPNDHRALIERMDLARGMKLTFTPSGVKASVRAWDKRVPNGAIEL